MSNKTYDIIKDFSLLWMPAAITLLGVIWAAWGLPYGEPIIATFTGINTFFGAITKYYKSRYDKSNTDGGADATGTALEEPQDDER